MQIVKRRHHHMTCKVVLRVEHGSTRLCQGDVNNRSFNVHDDSGRLMDIWSCAGIKYSSIPCVMLDLMEAIKMMDSAVADCRCLINRDQCHLGKSVMDGSRQTTLAQIPPISMREVQTHIQQVSAFFFIFNGLW